MDKAFGNKMLTKRLNAKLTREELAEYFGVKGTNVAKWEKGSIPQNPEVYQKVKEWLENGATHYTMTAEPGSFKISDRNPRDTELIELLKADKGRYIKIIEGNLASINMVLTKLADTNSHESQKKTQHTQEDQGGRKILQEIPSFGGKSKAPGRRSEQDSTRVKGVIGNTVGNV